MNVVVKLLAFVLIGAIGVIPLRVMAAMVMAPFKANDNTILAVSTAASFTLAWALIFWNPEVSPRDPTEDIRGIERAKSGLLSDLERERSECRALAISLSAEPKEERDKLVSKCFDSVRASAEITTEQLRKMDRRIEELRPASR